MSPSLNLTYFAARAICYAVLWASLLSTCSARAQLQVDQRENGWSEYEYTWRSLHILIRTDAGLFSPALQRLGKEGSLIGPFSGDKLTDFVQGYFVMTSAVRMDGEKDDFSLQFDRVFKQWGFGHTLPIIAAVAIENITRPIPSIFVQGVETYTFKDLSKVSAASIDPTKSDSIRLVVYSNADGFREAALRSGHNFARAYYNGEKHEVGLMLNMQRFRTLYANFEQNKDRQIMMLPAFISFVSEAFNDDSGHEITHFMQQQRSDKAYTIPAIAEGEAEVNGYTQSRHGLIYSLMYDTPDAWMQGRFDREVLSYRMKLMQSAGRPPESPFEVQRFQELRALKEQGTLIPVGQLLSRTQDFYIGDQAVVWSRYLHSWALYLLAIRDKEAGDLLRKAVSARVSAQRVSEAETALDTKLSQFIADPVGFNVPKERILSDAEKVYRSDRTFAGLFYAWAYIADPLDVRTVVYLGDSFYDGADLSSAEKYYQEARRLRPASALPLLRLGDVEAAAGNKKKAMQFWQQAAETVARDEGEEIYRSNARQRMNEITNSRK
jgi:hypothetical protein